MVISSYGSDALLPRSDNHRYVSYYFSISKFSLFIIRHANLLLYFFLKHNGRPVYSILVPWRRLVLLRYFSLDMHCDIVYIGDIDVPIYYSLPVPRLDDGELCCFTKNGDLFY